MSHKYHLFCTSDVDQTNVEVNNEDSFTDGDSIISSSDDSFKQYYLIRNHTQDEEEILRNNSPQ